MRLRLRLVPPALVAMLAFAAVSAAAASADAPTWSVKGVVLPTANTRALESTNEVKPQLEVPALKATITCTASTSTGFIVGNSGTTHEPGTAKEVVVNYTGCTVPAFPKCTVRSSTPSKTAGNISTNKLKGTLVWLAATGNSDGLLLQAESGSNFTTLEFGGSGCTLPEAPLAVTGAVIGRDSPEAGGTEMEANKLIFPKPAITKYFEGGASRSPERTLGSSPAPNRLSLGGNPATYIGEESVKLNESGVHPVWGTVSH